jgi:uncharacterized membrane protein HdeD (DUF308 family)
MRTEHTYHKGGFSWVQVCWLLGGILLFAGGVLSIISHDNSMVRTARPLGLLMFLAGIINFAVCDIKNHEIHGSRWLIADGVATILLSLFPMFNQIISPVMVPFFFGMWELFSGILKVMDSTELKQDKMRGWVGIATIGFVELASGTASLIKPFDDLVGISLVIAIIFFVQGCGFILKASLYKHLVD